jgi:D-glutamate cyclase
MPDPIEQIEILCGRVVRRNIARIREHVRGDLRKFAESLTAHSAARIAILTGFYIPQGQPAAAETDGLSGAVMMAAGLKRGGHQALVATDLPCYPALKAAAEGAPVPVEVWKCGIDDAAVMDLWRRLQAWGVTHVVIIERAGVAEDGCCYDMMGNPLDEFTAEFDLIVAEARKHKVVTLGVGDGGNEIGMGKIAKSLIAADIENGPKIACVTATDYAMVCGVSNWSGAALLSAMAILNPKKSADYLSCSEPAVERSILEHAVYLGPAIDDIGDPKTRPGRKVLWIDDIPLDQHLALSAELRQLALTA